MTALLAIRRDGAPAAPNAPALQPRLYNPLSPPTPGAAAGRPRSALSAQPVEGDCRDPASLTAAVAGVDAICCCTGTTAFPSKRWAVV